MDLFLINPRRPPTAFPHVQKCTAGDCGDKLVKAKTCYYCCQYYHTTCFVNKQYHHLPAGSGTPMCYFRLNKNAFSTFLCTRPALTFLH